MKRAVFAALGAALILAAPATAQQRADGATPTRAGANHALAGKTCYGSWIVQDPSKCADINKCRGGFRVTFDRTGGAQHGALFGPISFAKPDSLGHYQLQPVSGLTVSGGVVRYTTAMGVPWTLNVTAGTGENNAVASGKFNQNARVQGLVCS